MTNMKCCESSCKTGIENIGSITNHKSASSTGQRQILRRWIKDLLDRRNGMCCFLFSKTIPCNLTSSSGINFFFFFKGNQYGIRTKRQTNAVRREKKMRGFCERNDWRRMVRQASPHQKRKQCLPLPVSHAESVVRCSATDLL